MPADVNNFSFVNNSFIQADAITIGGIIALDNEWGYATSPRPPSVKTEMKISFNAVAPSLSMMGSLLH